MSQNFVSTSTRYCTGHLQAYCNRFLFGAHVAYDSLAVMHPLLSTNNSPMKTLARTLLRLDGLSHVLAWTRDPVLACKDAASLHFVELPRLRLRFEAKSDGPGGKVVFFLLFCVTVLS